MDLTPTDEQRQIAQSAEAFLADASGMAAVRRVSESGDGFDRALWRGIAGLGWCGVRLPDAVGGLDAGWVALALLQEQLGRHLACVPFLDSVALATTLLQQCGPACVGGETWRALAHGSLTLACALPEPGAALEGRALHADGGLLLTGRWPRVGSARFADSLLLPALDAAGATLLLLVPAGTPGLHVTPLPPMDRTRCMADVQAEGLRLDAAACLAKGAIVDMGLRRTRCLAAIALAAEQVGVAQATFDRTLAYTLGREQFGRSIAQFQAIKHRCAQMLVALETARSAAYGAACMADTGPDNATLLLHAAQARDAATEAARLCTSEAIQLHGGVGFTWEYDLHLFLRRAQGSSQRFGPVGWWRERVAELLLDEAQVAV